MVADDPFRRMMEGMRDAFEQVRALDQEFGGGSVPVDVQEDDDQVVVRADLPGVETDRIQVAAEPDRLTITARDEREVAEEQENYVRRERSSRRFRRAVTLPSPVDPDTAEASYENGVLTVTLEKAVGGEKRDVPVS